MMIMDIGSLVWGFHYYRIHFTPTGTSFGLDLPVPGAYRRAPPGPASLAKPLIATSFE